MTYAEKLKDPRWQKKRLEILQRDGFSCQFCGDTETELHVHHKEYSGEPWEADNDNLQTLCKHCHSCVEQMKDFVSKPIGALKEPYGDKYKSISIIVNRPTGGKGIIVFLYNDEDKTSSCLIALTDNIISRIHKCLNSVQPEHTF